MTTGQQPARGERVSMLSLIGLIVVIWFIIEHLQNL